jgi:hypothetical protein
MALVSRNFGFIANDIAYPPSPPPPTLPTIQAISTNKIMGLLLECECRVFLGLIIFSVVVAAYDDFGGWPMPPLRKPDTSP